MLGMFFVCGITSSGVAETHLIFWAKDQGMTTMQAAALASTKTFVNSCSLFLASMHTMWGHDPAKPLAIIYFMRGVQVVLRLVQRYDRDGSGTFDLAESLRVEFLKYRQQQQQSSGGSR